MKITKTVIPAAGLGTRFLPYTKVVPKEMLPILGKPAIQTIIEESLASNISDFIIIANQDKQALFDHFLPLPQLEQKLKATKKEHLLDSINKIIATTNFSYIPQYEQRGLGHAVLQTKQAVGDEYFCVSLPDEIMINDIPALEQLMAIAQKYNASVIAVKEVPHDKVSSYGVIAVKEKLESGVYEVSQLVEKPPVDQAPSNLAIIGRYVLSPRIFDSLEKIGPGAGGEIQLTDGIADMMQKGERVLALKLKGIRHDVGNPIGWLQANIHLALLDPTFGPQIKAYCKDLMP